VSFGDAKQVLLPRLNAICNVYGTSYGRAGVRLALGQRGASSSSQTAPQARARPRVMCGVSAVRGPISDPRGPYVHAQSIRLKLRCDRKVRAPFAFFFCLPSPGANDGPCFCFGNRFLARRVLNAGARRYALMVRLGPRPCRFRAC
jgi:hypothetical protein